MPDFIATLLFKSNPEHNPSNKITDACQVSPVCTDSTGAHHSILIHAEDYKEASIIAEQAAKELACIHITRVELVQTIYSKRYLDALNQIDNILSQVKQ